MELKDIFELQSRDDAKELSDDFQAFELLN